MALLQRSDGLLTYVQRDKVYWRWSLRMRVSIVQGNRFQSKCFEERLDLIKKADKRRDEVRGTSVGAYNARVAQTVHHLRGNFKSTTLPLCQALSADQLDHYRQHCSTCNICQIYNALLELCK